MNTTPMREFNHFPVVNGEVGNGVKFERIRNQCFPDQWWGHPIIEGKIMKRHTIVLKAEDVVALPVPEGFQRVFPGLLKG